MNRPDDVFYPFVGLHRVFPALQDKCAEAQTIAVFAACKDLFFAESVPVDVGVACPDSAIVAVVPAVIAHFNQSPDVDVVSEHGDGSLPRFFV